MVIDADKRRLARVFQNLLDNAAIHGGGGIEVSVDAAANDVGAERVRIAVEDHGPGVPADERTRVFERFARGTNAGRRGKGEGAGLGLALVEESVRLHGGQVWVEDRADSQPGARFVVDLPTVPV
jgi:two-component system, OmpR family, sensor histidine kinase MtrB